MKNKKLAYIILILIVFTAIFWAFNGTKAPQKKKLTFWTIQLKTVYEKQLNEIFADFEKKHPDYKIVWVDIPIQEAQKRTLASILSSTPPDLVNLNPDFSVILAQRNALEFFNEDEVEQFEPALVDKLRYDGKIYALPFYATSPVTIYNKEIYNKCINSKFIKTYDELFKISPKLKSCSGISPFAASLNENDTLAKILNKYDIFSLENENEKQKTADIFSKLDKMYKHNELPKDVLTINHREVIEKYMSNQALIIVAGSNFINMIKQNAPDIYSKSALAAQLSTDNGKYDISLMNLIIPKKSKNKDVARELALELTNRKHQLELSKLTNVLPVNKYALNDEFFKNCGEDLVEKSRCESAKQLNRLVNKNFGDLNKKEINESINKALEEILLDENSTKELINKKIDTLEKELNLLK